MKYDDLFFRGEFINLLIKYGVDPKKWANTHHLILIPIILIGLLLLYLVRIYHVETKWNLLLTAIIGLAQGWVLIWNFFRYFGENKNAFLKEIFPMELTSKAIPTIVFFINKKMVWIYIFWFTGLVMVGFSWCMEFAYANIYIYVLNYIVIYAMWMAINFLFILYLYYKKIS